jgi:hypothetical protein
MKTVNFFVLLLLITACTQKPKKQSNNLELMNKEVTLLYRKLEWQMVDNIAKTKPYYEKARRIKKAVDKITEGSSSGNINNADFTELKSAFTGVIENKNDYSKNLKKLIAEGCETMSFKSANEDPDGTIGKVKILEILTLSNILSSINDDDYKFDELQILSTKKIIKKGDKYSTEIVPFGVNNFEESLIIIAKDTIGTTGNKGIFETTNYKIGTNKIPATYVIKKNGQLLFIPFEIEFEVK